MNTTTVGRDSSTAKTPRASAAPPTVGVIISCPDSKCYPRQYKLQEGSCIVGAGSSADLILCSETVSRRHVELQLVPGGVLLTDLASSNGTYVLGQRVEQTVVSPGSTVTLGECKVKIDIDPSLYCDRELNRRKYLSLIGSSPAMDKLVALLHRLEGSLVDVLIEGESGTGKEVIANCIHDHSRVTSGPFVPVNCGALHKDLVQSELFGHRKGAFTGAMEHRPGAFEAADGGTLFLDEVGELAKETQPLLLRVLQERQVTRLGETTPRPFQVRVLAATNRNLLTEVQEGRFREDLYYRLNVVSVRVPPLRERGEDIRLLATHLAQKQGASELPESILEELSRRAWPGNVRQLAHSIQSYLAIGELPPVAPKARPHLSTRLGHEMDLTEPYDQLKSKFLSQFQEAYLRSLFAETGGNISEASRRSGIDRSHLSKLAKRFASLN